MDLAGVDELLQALEESRDSLEEFALQP